MSRNGKPSCRCRLSHHAPLSGFFDRCRVDVLRLQHAVIEHLEQPARGIVDERPIQGGLGQAYPQLGAGQQPVTVTEIVEGLSIRR